MRIFLFILGVFAAVVCFEKPAAAHQKLVRRIKIRSAVRYCLIWF